MCKRCVICGKFYAAPKGVGQGRRKTCSLYCRAEVDRKHRAKWRSNNREKALAYTRSYHKEHRVLEPQKYKDRHTAWRKANPEIVLSHARKSNRLMRASRAHAKAMMAIEGMEIGR